VWCACRKATSMGRKRRSIGTRPSRYWVVKRASFRFLRCAAWRRGDAYHRAYTHATQQALLEAHEHAFAYFGGVFRTLRYDNLIRGRGASDPASNTLAIAGWSMSVRLPLTRPHQLVSREELHSILWLDGTHVDFDHGLNATVNRLRQVLSDSADGPQ